MYIKKLQTKALRGFIFVCTYVILYREVIKMKTDRFEFRHDSKTQEAICALRRANLNVAELLRKFLQQKAAELSGKNKGD